MRVKKLEDSELKERIAFAKKHPFREFAEKYGVSYSATTAFYHKNGIKSERTYKGLNGHPIAEVRKFAKSNTLADIARKFDVKIVTACSYLRYHGIEYKNKQAQRTGTGERDEMIRYLSQKFSYAAIGYVFGFTRENIRQICLKGEAV